jgi:hypothetical protein
LALYTPLFVFLLFLFLPLILPTISPFRRLPLSFVLYSYSIFDFDSQISKYAEGQYALHGAFNTFRSHPGNIPHGIGVHSHGIGVHSHGTGVHSHGTGVHSHGIGVHSHGIGVHSHGIGVHSHGTGVHSHGIGVHSHGIGVHAETVFV